MAVMSSKVVRLTFNTARGGAFSVTLPNPRPDLDQVDALAVMDAMVENTMLVTPSGAITGVRDVKIIKTETEDLYDPPQG